MEERSQFTFYLSFAKAIQRIKKPAERCEAYDSIVNYALYGKEPGDDISDSAAMVFELAKPTFDTARKNAEKMQRSRNKSQERTGNSNVTVTEHADDAVTEKLHSEKEIEVEIEKEKEIDIPPLSPTKGKEEKPDVAELFGYNKFLLEAVNDWLAYKQEQRKPYKPVGLRNLLSTIQKKVSEYGEDAVAGVIRDSMSANYQGIVWDWLNRKSWNNNQSRKTNNIFLEMYEEEYGQTANNEGPFGS